MITPTKCWLFCVFLPPEGLESSESLVGIFPLIFVKIHTTGDLVMTKNEIGHDNEHHDYSSLKAENPLLKFEDLVTPSCS